jgi:hypothetical protein
MFNPFEEESSEHWQPTAFPVSMQEPQEASPITFLQLEPLAEQVGEEVGERRQPQVLREIKAYAESLEQRNLELACELEKERNRNKQLMSALSLLATSEEERSR